MLVWEFGVDVREMELANLSGCVNNEGNWQDPGHLGEIATFPFDLTNHCRVINPSD